MISSRFFQRITNLEFYRELNIALITIMLPEFFSICNIFTKMLERGGVMQLVFTAKNSE